jgi:type IV pilus assembly protein PilW
VRGLTRHRRQRGLTLIELMISLAIGLILVAGLALLFSQQSSTQAELEKSSRQIENGRYAMQLLKDDLQLAGYYGEFYNTAALTVPTVLPDPCLSAVADLTSAMAFPVQGYNAPTSLSTLMPSCGLSSANFKAGTDILVLRRADTTAITSGPTAGQVYLQTGLTVSGDVLSFVMGMPASNVIDTTQFNLRTRTGTVAPLRKYLVHIYYISPCSVPANGSTCSSTNTDDGGVSVPTLKRMELSVAGGAPTFTTMPLVEGIENMQLTYGMDTSVGGLPNPDAEDGVPDSEVDDVATVANWVNVMTVRIHLLARNNEASVGYKDDRTYQLGGVTTTATNDRFKRHVFSQMVRVVNTNARRQQ